VESLFVETAEGERYKLPFTKLSGGRAMVEHVRAGGRPYDVRGQHISQMVTELAVLSRFRRANQGRIFEGDTAALVEKTQAYYETAQRTLKSLATRSGYETYFESWNPNDITEQEVVIESLKHLFVTQTLDHRIEEALPILARIQQQGTDMKEANIFETWANSLVEGTWATPDTPEKQAELVRLMSAEFPVGADATNATEQLYDLIGDDELVDRLQELAANDANADARQTVYDRMQELANDPDIAQVMNQFTMDMDTPAVPAEPVQEGQMKELMWRDAERMEREDFVDLYGGEDWVGEFWDKIMGDVSEYDKVDETSNYPEYQDDLADILKNAGVDNTAARAAPDYEAEVDEMANPGVTPADIDGTAEETLAEFAPLAAAIGGALARGVVGAGAGALTRGAASLAGQAAGNAVGNALSGDDDEDLGEGGCNMTEAGESCPQHGMMECGMEESALSGQYGHSGRMKPVEKDVSFLDRLKELSGMMRK
jgi:hypothetical protein